MMHGWMTLFLNILLLDWIYFANGDADDTSVSHIYPRRGSVNGATRITIYGTNFAKNQFNFGADSAHLGNRVELVSATRVFECEIHKDGCTEVQLMCYTVPMMVDDYYVRVFVDGEKVPSDNLCRGNPYSSHCKFSPNWGNTPTITSLGQSSAKPGSIISLDGRIMTNLYEPNEEEADNGVGAKLSRVYFGGQLCDIRKPGLGVDEYYGFGLYEYNERYYSQGYIKCKPHGTYVGNHNISYIINDIYGRSQPDISLFRITAQNKITMIQTYAEITGVYPSVGSVEGGTMLTITGNYFDDTDAPVKVSVNDINCVVQEFTDTEIKCKIGPDPAENRTDYPGNRGVMCKVWNNTGMELTHEDLLAYTQPTISLQHLDDFFYEDMDYDRNLEFFQTLSRAYFVPPQDGDYRFYLKSDDQSELWIIMPDDPLTRRKIAYLEKYSHDYFRDDLQRSERLTLHGGKRYLLEVSHKEYRAAQLFSVAVQWYDTIFTAKQTFQALNEIQIIHGYSNATSEVQRISLEDWSPQSGSDEVQTVQITTDENFDSQKAFIVFRLGLYGVYTAPIMADVTTHDLKNKLNELQCLTLNTRIDVAEEVITNGRKFTLTFVSDRGDWPDISCTTDPMSVTSVNCAVTETSQGVPSMEYLVLSFDGVPSAPIQISTISQDTIKETLLDMFSVRCPEFMSNPRDTRFHQNFESSTNYPEDGTRTNETEPYCGHTSSHNPQILYSHTDLMPEIDIYIYPMLCFAHKGSLDNNLLLNYDLESAKNLWGNYPVTWKNSSSWDHDCVSMMDLLMTRYPSDTTAILKYAGVKRVTNLDDLYIDEIAIGRTSSDALSPFQQDTDFTTYRRLRPSEWIGRDFIVEEYDILVYDITFDVYNCAYNLPLFNIEHSELVRSTSSSAEFQFSSGNSNQVLVTRENKVEPPLEGTFSITHQGRTVSDISTSVEADHLKELLESLGNVGQLVVTRSGDCHGYSWSIEWNTYPGEHPELQIDTSQITGYDASMWVVTEQNGGTFFDPIPGDMLQTVHDAPQVVVAINNIPSVCSGECTFQWNMSATPVINSVYPASGSLVDGTNLNITGSGFDDVSSNNVVTIGGIPCNITSATTSEIICDIGEGPAGTHDVMLNVQGKGFALHDGGKMQFTYTFELTSFTPTEGGIGGGTLITINGTGFGRNVQVNIGGEPCDIETSKYDVITCFTQLVASEGIHNMTVSNAETPLTASTQFTFRDNLTCIIDYISQTTFSVTGGNITLHGSGFGDVPGDITLDGEAVVVVSYNDTDMELELGSKKPGNHTLYIPVDNQGYSLYQSELPVIEYRLILSGVEPTAGSIYGGSMITLTGEGFGSDPIIIDTTIGGIPCDIDSVEDTQIICQLETPFKTHKVTNQGLDPDGNMPAEVYDVGYVWQPQVLDVTVGDIVRWEWRTPDVVEGIGYRVEKTLSADATSYAGSGFRSSTTKSANGIYEHQFTSVGQYHYWSGSVSDIYDIYLRGVIYVHPSDSFSGDIVLKMNGQEADQVSSSGIHRQKREASCVPVALQEDCVNSTSSGKGLSFKFAACLAPTVTNISPTSGNEVTNITITGINFGNDTCQNEVDIGGYSCVVMASSSTEMICQLETRGSMRVGTPHEVHMRVNNLGKALLTLEDDMARRFVLLPHVSSLSPSSGSTEGGTEVTILGGGFVSGITSVLIANTVCNVVSITYDEIKCLTGRSVEITEDVQVFVSSGGGNILSDCITSCSYSFTALSTPVVSSVDPVLITDSSQNITITGSGFSMTADENLVYIGETLCEVISASTSVLTCDTGNPIAGIQSFSMRVISYGNASISDEEITVQPPAPTVSPIIGSTGGGTHLVLRGFGFLENSTTVTIDENPCKIIYFNDSYIVCESPPGTIGDVDLVLTSNLVQYEAVTFTYSSAVTTKITSLSADSGTSGDSLTIYATDLTTDQSLMAIMIGDAACTITSLSASSVQCTLGLQLAGEYSVQLWTDGWGYATGDQSFSYYLTVTSISPISGSYGGGQLITVTGAGFAVDDTKISVCGQLCELSGTPTSSQAICLTPHNSGSSTTLCNVTATVGDTTSVLDDSYTYDISLTTTISDVNPRRGGTGGGTSVTITGSGFGTTIGDVAVTIDQSVCTVDSVSDTQIICTTDSHSSSGKANVTVQVSTDGIAVEDSSGAAEFYYIDLWGSRFTWGGLEPPVAGDFVIIPKGMTVLLDEDTPVLKILLIQGGKVEFDEKDVQLNAEIILITDGGTLQVGTEEEPFQHLAVITMHGHVLSKEIPIYGTKCIAVREGTLDFHGKHVDIPWTRLGTSASAGDTSITLEKSVDWDVGSSIVIATTGERHSQIESEEKIINAVSSDGFTLTLDSPLEYDHLGETISLSGGEVLEARAEVGLLSRNIIFQGSVNTEWNDTIEACPEGFDTGEFVVQTCFQGRFGEETGSDNFGGHIIFHSPRLNDNGEMITARIENVELTNVGQAFRLGRYAIHFHLLGNMPQSYVRSCAIHKSFNRAVNIHNTHSVTVEYNVAYNIMGGAFFLEDGIETGNIFQYNLAIFVISSTSLQNDDITPAAFWITNANNTVRHNAAAGGTHFGFWYRLHEKPDGPSFDPNICPRLVPLLEFKNNTVHSFGWFGLWIFQVFTPVAGGLCGSNDPEPARFESLITWNSEKGAEWVGAGAIQFIDFIMVHNEVAGIEMKMVIDIESVAYTDKGPMIDGGIIASYAGSLNKLPTATGLLMPFGHGLIVQNTVFLNFDTEPSACFSAAAIDGTTKDFCGGYTYVLINLSFDNSDMLLRYNWIHEAVYWDLDGSFCGSANCKVVPDNPTLPPECSVQDASFAVNAMVPGSTCDSTVTFRRFSFNQATPQSLLSKNVTFTNQYGTTYTPFEKKRFTHPLGWMVVLAVGEEYIMTFENAEQITNISYLGRFDMFQDDDFLLISHNFTQRPDQFQVLPGITKNESTAALTYGNNANGDWFFDEDTTYFSYIISSKSTEKGTGSSIPTNINVNLDVLRCFYDQCIPPVDPNDLPPPTTRPEDYILWHDASSWDGTEEGWGGNYMNGSYGPPGELEDVKIPAGEWMVVEKPIPMLGTIWIYGVLEFEFAPEDGYYRNFTFSAENIIIVGGRLIVGWEDNPFYGQMEIILRGNHLTPQVALPSGPVLGAKALGVFGGLDLHGAPRNISWTQLSQTASAGDTSITLLDAVDWEIGHQIVIAPMRLDLEETEILTIIAISDDQRTLTLNEPLTFIHYASVESIGPSDTFTMAAEVGLLTRNVKIIGEDYSKLMEQAFGARILVSSFSSGEDVYTGYARVHNVEFYHTGQEGFTDWYDPRYSIAFLSTGDVTALKPSYVKSCAFHDGFSPAIGVFGTNYLEVSDNVVHHTVGSALIVKGTGNSILRNFVVKIIHPGVFNGRTELRYQWDAGIEAIEALDIDISGNHVAGSHRALYRVDGEPCSKRDQAGAKMWADNVGHSTLIGVLLLSSDGKAICTLLSNFTIYRSHDMGMYFQIEASVEVANYISVDNRVGLLPMTIKPASKDHLFADKYVKVMDSFFMGSSSVFDCSDSLSGPNIGLTTLARSWKSVGGAKGAKAGLSWPTFMSASNAAPEMPFIGLTTYNAINGLLTAEGVTFSNFNDVCDGKRDIAITTNPSNDDCTHPIDISGTILHNVSTDNKVFIHRSRLGSINPSDCVDMECDGQKKALLRDLDGSLMGGSRASVMSESEWAWDDVDMRARGIGDYRIPVTMLSYPNGSRMDVDQYMPHKGIIRDDNCVLVEAYQAHVCTEGLDYELLILESMDGDSETRRVSPVAVWGDTYIDLINGPQDHGWCFGYTCQKRLSTFPIILASGKEYMIHFTGVTPQDTRLHFLNADADQAVVVSIWYAQSWRLNVYVDGNYVQPINGYYTAANQLALYAPTTEREYIPDVELHQDTGTNYFDREHGLLYVLIRGSTPVDIKTDKTILVNFNMPMMTVDEFFGENIVSNLASFFDINKESIRFAKAVSESRRRKRETTISLDSFIIEIANPPQVNLGSSPGVSEISFEKLTEISATLVTTFQLGSINEILNVTITGMAIVEPPPQAGSESWTLYTELNIVGEVVLSVPQDMVIATNPVADGEANPFIEPLSVKMTDVNGYDVMIVGSILNPWVVSATLEYLPDSDTRAELGGTTNASFAGQYATFSDLTVSHAGSYMLRLAIVWPENNTFNELLVNVSIHDRNVTGKFISQPDFVEEEELFGVRVGLFDLDMDAQVEDVHWRGFNWSCDVFLLHPELYAGNLSITEQQILDNSDNSGKFQNLSITTRGVYVITARCTSEPSVYNLTFASEPILVVPPNYIPPVEDYFVSATLTFDADYSDVAEGKELDLAAAVYNYMRDAFPNCTFTNFTLSEGSIVVEFSISGTETAVNTTVTDIVELLKGSLTINFQDHILVALPQLLIDGESVEIVIDDDDDDDDDDNGSGNGGGNGSGNDDDDDDDEIPPIEGMGLSLGVIVGIGVAAGIAVIGLTVLITCLVLKKQKKIVNDSKAFHKVSESSQAKYTGTNKRKLVHRATVFISNDDDWETNTSVKGSDFDTNSFVSESSATDTDVVMSKAALQTAFPIHFKRSTLSVPSRLNALPRSITHTLLGSSSEDLISSRSTNSLRSGSSTPDLYIPDTKGLAPV